ncbi:MAG: arylesterase [Proteobacteria bacterium]|nr:arylesterase [Desulfobacula sp.]MBU3950599.1 arylesterase [Pseudomonadota bacterium]MBU4133604.1 arylesterase [Pseudomonadota bacterium]
MKLFKGFVFVFFIWFTYALSPSASVSWAQEGQIQVLFLGDSITAGLGVEPEQAYPALIEDMLKVRGDYSVKITNGSISGSTTAGALSRLKWFLRAKPKILVLALGANDGLRGLSTDEMAQNLDKTIVLAKKNHIRVVLAGMKIPPNYGPEYSNDFAKVFVALAEKYHLSFIPFLLKDVAGKASLNQADGIHPNQEGHKIIAATVFPYILEQL